MSSRGDRGTRTVVISIPAPQPTGRAFLVRSLRMNRRAVTSRLSERRNHESGPPVRDAQVYRQSASLKTECVIIVDDAHDLQADAIDEIRALLDSV